MNAHVNPSGAELARHVYAAAVHDGDARLPKAVSEALAAVGARQGQADEAELDVEQLGFAVDAEFAFLHPVVSNDRSVPQAQQEQWAVAVRALLQALKAWSPSLPQAADHLRVLLVSLQVLDVRGAGLAVATPSIASPTLTIALAQLVSAVEVVPGSLAMRGYPGLRDELRTASEQGNYERLSHYLAHLFPEPQLDLTSALRMLWELDQASALKAIAQKNDVLFYYAALWILEQELPTLAALAPNDVFRFVAVEYLQDAAFDRRPGVDWEQVVLQVLVAAASGSNWSSWAQALFKYFDQRSLPGRVLGRTLAAIAEDKWEAVIKAFSDNFTGRMAQTVAKTLAEFARLAGHDKAAALWKLAYVHWDASDYRRQEAKYHMFSPMPTSLDFPVSMYYSLLPAAEVNGEEVRLVAQLAQVEQKRYESASDLLTDRNRLLSRLRLLRHGRSIAKGATPGLPGPIAPEPDRYSQIRYHYNDYVARM